MLTRRRPHAGSSDDSAYGAEDDASKDKSTSAKWYAVKLARACGNNDTCEHL